MFTIHNPFHRCHNAQEREKGMNEYYFIIPSFLLLINCQDFRVTIVLPDHITIVETKLEYTFPGDMTNECMYCMIYNKCKYVKGIINIIPPIALIANLGGNLGLWLGVSLLDTSRLIAWVKDRMRRSNQLFAGQ